MTPVDIKRIAADALDRAEDVTRNWLPEGKRQGAEWIARNPKRDDKHAGNFSVNLDTGRWADFATDSKGGDLVALVAYLDGVKQSEAARRLAALLGVADVATPPERAKASKSVKPASKAEPGPIVPIPAHASPLPAHPHHGKPSAIWCYRDAESRPLFYVCRFDPPVGRKQICPLTWWLDGWRWKALLEPRPLYNLDKLAASPSAPVIVVEGEKAADAAAQLFSGSPTTTAPNGAQSPGKTDWRPMKGRRVHIWPDADEAGGRYVAAVARLARAAGAVEVKVLDPATLAIDPSTGAARELPTGWDAADALAEGWTAARLAELDSADKLFCPVAAPKEKPNTRDDSDKLPRFELRDDGVYYLGIAWNKDINEYEPTRQLWVSSWLKVSARTRDVNGEYWGRLLEFTDADGTLHRWAMPMNLLAASGEELRGELLRQGLLISSNNDARRRLADYIQEAKPEHHARCVQRTGWHNGACEAFVFPHRTLGAEAEPVLFQADSLDGNPYREHGTLAEWRQHVATLCVGNSRLVFSVSCGFAAALLGPVGEDGGGFHYRGDSSTGKSTALRVAASVWGGVDYLKRWRATENSLEALAATHCDTLLVLDEIAQMEGHAVGSAAYMLEAGRGKSRADRNGAARAVKTWRLLFLSAGEISLADHMATAGKRTHAGQEIRLCDIPADAGANLGLFEMLHDRESGHDLSRELCERAAHYYGTAGPAFIEQIIKHQSDIHRVVKDTGNSFAEDNLPRGAGGQALRAAARFALVAAAGELAINWGIVGWPTGEAERAAQKCFSAWIGARGGAGNLEASTLLRQIRRFLELHGEARFSPWDRAGDDRAPHTSNRAGFVKHTKGDIPDHLSSTFYILPEVFRRELCDGFDYREAEKILVSRGWLKTDPDGRPTRKERLPGFGKAVRAYVMALADMTDAAG